MRLVSTPHVCLTDMCPELTLWTSRICLSSHTYVWLPSPAVVLAFCWGNIAHAVEFHFMRIQKPRFSHKPTLWPGTNSLDLSFLTSRWRMKFETRWFQQISRIDRLTHRAVPPPTPNPMYTKLIPHSIFQKYTINTERHLLGEASWFSLMTLEQSCRTFSRKMLWEAETCWCYGATSNQDNSISECIVISFIRLIFKKKEVFKWL